MTQKADEKTDLADKLAITPYGTEAVTLFETEKAGIIVVYLVT